MGRESFMAHVHRTIRSQSRQPTSISENILAGCYVIMRKVKSYRLEDFMSDKFLASHYFMLTNLIQEESKETQKRMKQIKKG